MRKTIPKMVTAFLCLMIITLTATGCNFSFDDEKDLQVDKMEEQIKTLGLDNVKLKHVYRGSFDHRYQSCLVGDLQEER